MRLRGTPSGWLALTLICASCWGGDGATGPSNPAVEIEASAPAERLDATWPVVLATNEAVAPYAEEPGWVSLVLRRDIKAAVGTLGPKGGPAAARAHNEAAAMFRQAALLQSWSLIETYGKTPEPTDALGTHHLLTVSYALVGDLDKAKAESAKLGDQDDPTQAWHGPWRSWIDAGATWPPDLTGLPVELGPARVGGWPQVDELPHYRLPEQGGASSTRDMSDPGALVALALWHDAAARTAAPDLGGALSTARAGYQLPAEPVAAGTSELPIELLFGSDLLIGADGEFLAAVHGEVGLAAVEQFADRSLLAWLAKESRVEGKIDAERAVDVLAAFREDLLERAASKTGGEIQAHARTFVDVAYVGAFRSLALVAELEGDREASGLLRINAMERSQKATACPVGLIALGAWDASNRYPTRAQDILHAQARRFPSLEIARYGLDVMALRVSRERPGETPGM